MREETWAGVMFPVFLESQPTDPVAIEADCLMVDADVGVLQGRACCAASSSAVVQL